MRGRIELAWIVGWCAAVSSGGCAAAPGPGPSSPTSAQAEEAPPRQVATSLTRDPLAEPMAAEPGHEASHHHHHQGSAAAKQSSSEPAPAGPQQPQGGRPDAEASPHSHGSAPGAAASRGPQQQRAPEDGSTPNRVPAAVSPSAPVKAAADGGTPPEGTEYVCPMHPDVREPKPGRCPRCGMALVPTPMGPPGPAPKPAPKPEPAPAPLPDAGPPPKRDAGPGPRPKPAPKPAPQSAAGALQQTSPQLEAGHEHGH